MFQFKTKLDQKYFWIEFTFFIFICYLSSIISDLEYSYYEEHNLLNFTKALEARLVWGTFSFIFYGSFYWLILKRYVFERKLLYILLSVAGFIIFSHLYDMYVMNWSISKMSFLSDDLRSAALKDFKQTKLLFIISYKLNRIVFTIVGFAFLIRSLQQDEQLKNLREEQLRSELTYLKAQLQPHFFFNTLNNIYALAISQSRETAPMVAKLADMMRYIIYDADEKKVTLNKEVLFIENYVQLEKIRHSDEINISVDVQGVLKLQRIAPLLLLPFIENAFKHGLEEETGKGFVQIVLCIIDQELTLQVSNSKPQNVTSKRGGMGLQNAVKRLHLLYGEQYHLKVEDGENTYQVILTLPLHD